MLIPSDPHFVVNRGVLGGENAVTFSRIQTIQTQNLTKHGKAQNSKTSKRLGSTAKEIAEYAFF